MKLRTFLLYTALLPVLLSSNCNQATTELPLVGGTLDHFQSIVNQTMSQATQAGDILTMRVANEMEVLTQNLYIQFDGRYKTALRDLNDQERKVFDQLDGFQDELQSGITTIQSTQELLNLDLIQLTNRFRLFTKPVPFYISSIKGISIDQTEQEHAIEITGIGFGYSNDKEAYALDLTINNKTIPATAITLKNDKQLEVTIPRSFYEFAFQDTAVRFIPATLRVSKTLFIRKGRPTLDRVDTVPFNICILPKYGATLAWTEVVGISQPKDTLTHDLQFPFGGTDAKHAITWVQPWECPDSARIWKVEFPKNAAGANVGCTGPGCAWSASPDGGGDVSYFTNGAKEVTVRRTCWGPPCNYTHRVYYIRYGSVPKTQDRGTVTPELNKLYQLVLSSDNSSHEFVLTGKSFWGQQIYLDDHSDPQGPIKIIGRGDFAGRYQVTIKIGEPNPCKN